MASIKLWIKMTSLCKILHQTIHLCGLFAWQSVCDAGMKCRRRIARRWTYQSISESDILNTLEAPPALCCSASLSSSPCPDKTSSQTFFMRWSFRGLGEKPLITHENETWACLLLSWSVLSPLAGVMSNIHWARGMKAEPRLPPPLPAAVKLLNVPRHPLAMPVWVAAVVLCRTGPPAAPAPVTAATTRGLALKPTAYMMVSG